MDAIRASLRGTSSLVEAPETPVAPLPAAPAVTAAAPTLDEHVRSLLAPMLKAWLDANLPEIVDRAARDEIARLTKQG